MNISFNERTAIITGAGQGLGKAYALLLASRGCSVVINDINASAADKTSQEIRSSGGNALSCPGDITSAEFVQELVANSIREYGQIDAIINNAGTMSLGPTFEANPDSFWRQFNLHVLGAFQLTKAAWSSLSSHGRGRVVLVSSAAALGSDVAIEYATAKAAVIGLGKSLAMAGAEDGITCNIVMPTGATQMESSAVELGIVGNSAHQSKIMSPSMAANLIAVLSSDQCPTTGEIFVTGRGTAGSIRIEANHGLTSAELTPEMIVEQWPTVIERQTNWAPRNGLDLRESILQSAATLASHN